MSVFFSYAHADSLDFVRRLAFALSLYCEVFWDQRLPPGDFADELMSRIKASTHFVLVMSPFSLRDESYCHKELSHAIKCEVPISLVRLMPDSGHTFEDELTSKYTYADFASDFEQGFRRLTQMTIGTPNSSWEALTALDDANLIRALASGLLPGLIAKEIQEWVIVARLWPALLEYSRQNPLLMYSEPRTVLGVSSQAHVLREQFITNRDQLGLHYCNEILAIVSQTQEVMSSSTDAEHTKLGIAAQATISNVKQFLLKRAVARIDAHDAYKLGEGGYFVFEVAEKLRELINLHARRSRYLY